MPIRTLAAARAITEIPSVDVDPRDTDGRRLRLRCAPTDHSAVASTRVLVGRLEVRLDVLAASHRVTVRPFTDSDRWDTSWDIDETVACDDLCGEGFRGGLPTDHERRSGRWSVRFRSRIDVGADAVATAVAELAPLAGRADSSVVRFPGADDALTGLRLTSAMGSPTLAWQSWHCYPGTDPHVVRTTTVAANAGDAFGTALRLQPDPIERDRRP